MTPGDGVGNIILGGVSVINVAIVVYLVKIVIGPIAQTVKMLAESVDELYKSRNNHEVEITEIQTIHKIRGCNLPKNT